jgi:Coenzyme PQQ synthesis protein D (PqqD)
MFYAREFSFFAQKMELTVLKEPFGTSIAQDETWKLPSMIQRAKNAMDPKTNRMQAVVIEELTDGRPSESYTRDLQMLPKRRSDLNWRTIDGETLILNREEGRLHQLNPTASFIWDCCDGHSNIAEIIDRLASVYEVDARTACKDVEEVLFNLRSSKLLE